MSDWRPTSPGPAPTVAPGDLKAALATLLPITRSIRASKEGEGAVGISDSLFKDVCQPGANLAAVSLRAVLLEMALETGALDRLRNGDELPDSVFEIAAAYPFIVRTQDPSFEFGAFVQALQQTGGSE